ncbi:MAG: HAD-IA family hydrolase [Eubacteriales bacterium]
MSKIYDAVLFDFDGTVADTGKEIFNGVYHVLDAFGIEPPEADKLRYFIGPPLHDSFKTVLGFDDEACDAAIIKYREYYSVKGILELALYDGMEELFRKLKAENIKVGIASSKPEVFLQRIAENLQITELFDVICGSDFSYIHTDKTKIVLRAIENLNLPANAKVLMVGDRSFDIKGAKGAGVDRAGVLFGYGSREEFEEAGADYIVGDTDELFEIITGE